MAEPTPKLRERLARAGVLLFSGSVATLLVLPLILLSRHIAQGTQPQDG